MNRQLLIDMCHQSDTIQTKSLVEVLMDGAGIIKTGTGTSNYDGLCRTYRLRSEQLKSKNGAHAIELARSTSEFVTNLQKTKPERIEMVQVVVSPEIEYSLFVNLQAKEIIGCMEVISKLKVPAERWKEIWGEV